ncbi:MAG: hypothetical protein COB24_03465 [Hyphomicrobiales bacterium]|nr:MAG: hypothetical protein COB24_03465 [Hyphomicrobiales bacterium]
MKFRAFGLIIMIALSSGTMVGYAEDAHKGHTEHNMEALNEMPTEAGQSAFAAIAEIVEMLNEDPNTDWDKVDIDKLRNHLVDMNELTLNAKVERSSQQGAVIFSIGGAARTLKAIKAMVPAHAVELNKIDGWQVDVEIKTGVVIMRVSSDNAGVLAKVNALGFFGMMATGAHHQPHHWGMATGAMMGH